MKRRHLRQVAWMVLVLVLVGTLLPGCAPTPKPKITFVYSPYTDYAPAMVAEDKGYFDEMGLDVELMPKGGITAETYQLLASGDVTCGGSSWGASFFNAVALGTMVTIVSPMATMPTAGKSPSPLMVSKAAYDSGEVTTVADLRGKRIGIPGPGGFGEYSTVLALQSAGLTADDVELVNIGPPEIGVAMENGSIVASWTIEPFTTFLEREGIAVVLDDTSARGVELGFLAFDTNFVNENPEATAKFLAAYLKAYRELNTGGWDDPEIQEIVEKYTELPSDVLSGIGLTVLSPDYTINWDSVRAQEAYFRSEGVLEYEGELDFDAIYRKDILERALEILGE